MAKAKTVYACQACGHKETRWLGRCPDCGGWNTLVEEIVEREDKRPAWGAGGGGGKPVRLADVSSEREDRHLTSIAELDRVLGGGVVPGSLVLRGGDHSPRSGRYSSTAARSDASSVE